MRESFTNPRGIQCSIDLDEIKELIRLNQKISLIKEFRAVSGLGLKDSKDMVEKFYSNIGWNKDGLIDAFKQYAGMTPEPYTKDEFMHLVERAIDSMDDYHFTDMIQAVETMLHNVQSKGGLKALAKERDTFLNNI